MSTDFVPIINPSISFEWLKENYTGRGVTVAVVDSGVAADHPDLKGKVSRSCVVEQDNTGKIVCNEIMVEDSVDHFGHGTAVSGIITELAPEVEILNVKVLNEYNSCTGDVLIEGLKWALDQNVRLINMSLATSKEKFFSPIQKLCEQAYIQDTIVVASRRNFGGHGCPAMFSSVISVEREEYEDKYKLRYRRGTPIEYDARGTEVTVPSPIGGYTKVTGTSFATPHITGIVALLVEAFPRITPIEVKAVLKALAYEEIILD